MFVQMDWFSVEGTANKERLKNHSLHVAMNRIKYCSTNARQQFPCGKINDLFDSDGGLKMDLARRRLIHNPDDRGFGVIGVRVEKINDLGGHCGIDNPKETAFAGEMKGIESKQVTHRQDGFINRNALLLLNDGYTTRCGDLI